MRKHNLHPFAATRVLTRALLPLLTLLAPNVVLAANSDLERPLPNVMLLVDTSGSMEFTTVNDVLPVCTPGNSAATNQKSRWIELIEVMTGTFENYSCFAMDRSTTAFKNEFSLGSVKPYDKDYVLPYNRVLSNNCTVGPGDLPPSTTPYSFPDNGVVTLPFTAPSTVTRPGSFVGYTGCSLFHQATDGILDVFQDKIRFGLMTFDTHTDNGTGLDATLKTDSTTGVAGTWSYFLDNKPVVGRPANCATDQAQEVGARNAAAPPWEGRMIAFGAPNASTSSLQQRNQRIQSTLLAQRPYGATPIAGLLQDALEFLWNDTTKDPLDSSTTPADFGPRNDPATLASQCRRNIVILLSDGEPNLDLRPYCENTIEGGKCPYSKPEGIVSQLYNNPKNDPDQFVETYVVGFALSKVTPTNSPQIGCADLTDDQCAQNPNNRAIQACCTLNKIAAAGAPTKSDGSSQKAYFPSSGKELRQSLSKILSNISTNITTRTSASYGSAYSNGGGSIQFRSGFHPVPEQPWQGKLSRTRTTCDSGSPVEHAVEASEGDDFAANVNSGGGSPRTFYTYLPTTSSRNSLRPFISGNPDAIGSEAGSQAGPFSAAQFVSGVSAAAAEITSADCDAKNATTCRNDILGWLVGQTNTENETRCATLGSSTCGLFGAIYHSTPRIVPGAPNEFLRDESYDRYTATQVTAKRSSTLYTETLDGMLHAFRLGPQLASQGGLVDKQENNEMWAFIPPAVLPVLKAQYPNTPATLLDGLIAVRDVPGRKDNGVLTYSRTLGDAESGLGDWRTVAVSGFGGGQVPGGFFALDLTTPDVAQGGPTFRWQLTRDKNGVQLFGSGGTPIITTVFLKANSTDPGSEVAVAILPGGDLGTRTAATGSAGPLIQPVSSQSQFAPANSVAVYSGADAARSLTIVRLDTGEVLRSFRATATGLLSAAVTKIVDIPAPIVGQPAAFPGAVGTVADRIFVGDKEGRVWRLDVSKGLPSQWTFDVFFDVYYGLNVTQRQPIVTAPILSVDDIGQITLAVSSGDQGLIAATPNMLNRVVSLTEVLDSTVFRPKVNWVETLGCSGVCGTNQSDGERVTGPMTLFGGSLYFATTSPAATTSSSCSASSSRVWGVHYSKSRDAAAGAAVPDPLSGASGALPPVTGSTTARKTTDATPGVVFGVSVEQQPSCSTPEASFANDAYLGSYGGHSSTSAVTPGKFFLVTQVGGGDKGNSSSVATEKLELSPPRSSVLFDSWAPIFE